MDQLIADVAAKTGVSTTVARKAVAIIVSFIAREAPAEQTTVMMSQLPGAQELAKEATGRGGGLMGVFNDLTAAGLSLNGVQQAARMFVAFARTKLGDKQVDGMIRSIPGLSQFV